MLLGLTILLVLLAWMLGNTHFAPALLLDRLSVWTNCGVRLLRTRFAICQQALMEIVGGMCTYGSLRRIELQTAVVAVRPSVAREAVSEAVNLQALSAGRQSVCRSGAVDRSSDWTTRRQLAVKRY
jgi:hypothetical protein